MSINPCYFKATVNLEENESAGGDRSGNTVCVTIQYLDIASLFSQFVPNFQIDSLLHDTTQKQRTEKINNKYINKQKHENTHYRKRNVIEHDEGVTDNWSIPIIDSRGDSHYSLVKSCREKDQKGNKDSQINNLCGVPK
ncbi:hypothetical protein NPIL_83101 [Nephila pilipes]|uniref:Uncharacterized protein n=1 Tax=Nephila pilipes TaxID=299642 RepID=A0A8X6PG90_NEPPI|nr:hypothetical protein NPIL_83101 [Nephila pilipes]